MKWAYLLVILLIVPIAYSQECDGCIYRDSCIEVGTQKIINDNLFYCGEDKKLEDAKFFGYECFANYECISFYCNENKCDDLEYGKEFEEYSTGFSAQVFDIWQRVSPIAFPIIAGILGFGIISYLFAKALKKSKKKEQKKKSIKTPKKRGYRKTRGKSDKLEKDIEDSFKKVEKALK